MRRHLVLSIAASFVLLAACGSSTANHASGSPAASTAPSSNSPSAATKGCTAPAPKRHGNGKQYSKPPAMTIDPSKTYTATFDTTCGSFTATLDAKAAPKGVNNFVFLARAGFYDGLSWHRAVTNFVIQGGDPIGDGTGGPGYSVVTETPINGYQHGDLAWAKTANDPPGTAGSQFFVTTGDPTPLNSAKDGSTYPYGTFGHVTSGADVAKKIESFAPATGDGPPTAPMYILKVTITEH